MPQVLCGFALDRDVVSYVYCLSTPRLIMAVAHRGIDLDKCYHYARFAAHLEAVKFDVVYWLLFLLVVSMLFCSSWYYGRYVRSSPGQHQSASTNRA